MKILDRKTLFESELFNRDLARKSVRGGMVTIGSQCMHFVLQITSTIVLARLLTPADYGLIGMVVVFVNFAAIFKDAGLAMATVQKEKITHGQISTLFWINVLISVGLNFCILACAPLVAWFYDKAELGSVTAALSFSIVLSGLTIQHQALLRRHMRFGTLALIQICSHLASIGITITLALLEWNYWALVCGTLTNALIGTLLNFVFCPWVPGRMQRGVGVRGMLKFGGNLTGFEFINYFARNADNILIGKFIGADALGIYSRAYQLLMLPITMISRPLGAVAIPALCRLNEDRGSLHKYYLFILYMLSLIAGPIAGISFLASKEIIILLLGQAWIPVADVFRYLAIGSLLQPLYNTQAWLHLAVGRADRVLIWGLIGTPVIVVSFIVGLFWGINGVAFCYSIAIVLTTAGSLSYAGKSAGLSFWKMLGAVSRPILSCFGAVIAVDALSTIPQNLTHLSSLIIKGTEFIVLYSVFLLIMYNGSKPLRDLTVIGKMMTRQNGRKCE